MGFGKSKKAKAEKASTEAKTEAVEKSIEESKEESRAVTEKTVKPEMKLFILCDSVPNKFMRYIEESGMHVDEVYNNIEQARDELLLEYETYRILIVDTGTGKFSGVSQRRDIVDLLGIMDEECRASLFYTDEALRQEIRQGTAKAGKKIVIYKYKGTADMILETMRLGEKYQGSYKARTSEIEEKQTKVITEDDIDKFRYRNKLMPVNELVYSMARENFETIKSYNDYI